jgi:hypothetical protein
MGAEPSNGGVKRLVRLLAQPPRGADAGTRVWYGLSLVGSSVAVIIACALLALVAPAPLAAIAAMFLWLFAILMPAAQLQRLGSPPALWLLIAVIMGAVAFLTPGLLHSQALHLWGTSVTAVVAEHHTQRSLAPSGGRRSWGIVGRSVHRYTLRSPDGTLIRQDLVRDHILQTSSCTVFEGDPRDLQPAQPLRSCNQNKAVERGDSLEVVFDPHGLFPPIAAEDFDPRGAPDLLVVWLVAIGTATTVAMLAGWRAVPPEPSPPDRRVSWQERREWRRKRRRATRSRRRNRRP